MPQVRTETVKKRELVPYSQIRYSQYPVETAIMIGNMDMLNKDEISYTNPIKEPVKKSFLTETGERVRRDVEDRKRLPLTVASVASPTQFDLTTVPSNLKPGVQLYNATKQEVGIVSTIVGSTITLLAAMPSVAAGDILYDNTTSKAYGIDDGKQSIRNDYNTYENIVQFAEYQIPSDMIENNKTYLHYEDNDKRRAELISDSLRDAQLDVLGSFYNGVAGVNTIGANIYYSAGGLNNFILAENKVKINQGDRDSMKSQIFNQLQKAYKSGVRNIYKNKNLIFVCNTKFRNVLAEVFAHPIQYNDMYKDYNVRVGSIDFDGFVLNHVVSSFLDERDPDVAIGYLMPVNEVSLFSLPKGAWTSADGKKIAPYNTAVYYKKPRTTYEKEVDAVALNRSFIFNYHTTAAYQRLIVA